jgi:hypothetical protein
MKRPIGWRNEPGRHALAARGIPTVNDLTPFERSKVAVACSGGSNYLEGVRAIGARVETGKERADFLEDYLESVTKLLERDHPGADTGLVYEYSPNEGTIVVRIDGVTWYDSESDPYDSFDFKVLAMGMADTLIRNAMIAKVVGDRGFQKTMRGY